MSYTFSTARIALRSARTYATHIAPRSASAVLHLKTGQSFAGKSFGAPKSVFGETVFSTSITSCGFLFFFIASLSRQDGGRLGKVAHGDTDQLEGFKVPL